jgi:Ca2+-binding RTX toxin-like protein
MKAKIFRTCTFVVLTMLTTAPLELSAWTLGMVADRATFSVTIFDADTHVVLGTVPISPSPGFGDVGDVLIAPDLKQGFVTNNGNQVFVIDLTTSPPGLAGGTNPISISNLGSDLSISPDGKFLVVGSSEPISVIDIAARAEISTFFTGFDTSSVDVCSDGSVLITSFDLDATHRLTLSGTGTLTDTGEVLPLSVGRPTNVYCAPGAQSGVAIEIGGGDFIGAVTSFTIPGLSAVDIRTFFNKNTFSGTINPTGNRVFVESAVNLAGSIDVFDFNSPTGALGASPLLTFSVGFATPFSGFDQIALHPNSTKLFVSEISLGPTPGAVNVYDPNTGALLASITDPAIVSPTGVTVVTEADPCALPPPTGAIVGTNGPDILNGTPFGDTIFGLGGPDILNGKGGDDLICGGAGGDLITGGAGNDTLNTQDGVSGNDSASGGAGNNVCTGDPGDALSSCNP